MTDKLRQAAQMALEALEKEPADYADWIRTMKAARAALRAALAEQPAEQESMAVACQISALGDSWADFPLERAQEAIEHGLNVRYLGVLRQKPVKPAEQSASHGEPVVVPLIDYDALIAAAYAANKKWAQGTNGCIAFKHGAEWFRQTLAAASEAPQPAKRESLTDERINSIFEGLVMENGFWLNFARAIERAHGIGGEV